MSKEIKPDYTTQFLLPPSLEDWIAEDHPARFIREFVDVLDLEETGFKIRPEDDRGRSNYSTDLLLKVWLYGYVERIYSTRKLERACMNQMPLIWLTGNNVPDHNTLWRFFKDNRNAMKKLFQHTAKLALDAGMVGMVLHAVDGTKVRARGSEEKILDRERIDELMARIEESVDRMIVEVDANEGSEEGSYRMPSELASSEKLREYLLKAKEQMETEGIKYLHPFDMSDGKQA
jgi:transposase